MQNSPLNLHCQNVCHCVWHFGCISLTELFPPVQITSSLHQNLPNLILFFLHPLFNFLALHPLHPLLLHHKVLYLPLSFVTCLSFTTLFNCSIPPTCLPIFCLLYRIVFSFSGGGWLEVCCHGDRQDIPLGLHNGLHPWNPGPLPAACYWLSVITKKQLRFIAISNQANPPFFFSIWTNWITLLVLHQEKIFHSVTLELSNQNFFKFQYSPDKNTNPLS